MCSRTAPAAHPAAASTRSRSRRSTQAGVDTQGCHSKSWDDFARDGAPPLDIVITVCDSAAAETCPLFIGRTGEQPVKVHWGYPDPSHADGGDEGKRRAFELTRQAIGYRMLQLLALPLADAGPQRAAVGAAGHRPQLRARPWACSNVFSPSGWAWACWPASAWAW